MKMCEPSLAVGMLLRGCLYLTRKNQCVQPKVTTVMLLEICAYFMRAGIFCLKHGLKTPRLHGSCLMETIGQD